VLTAELDEGMNEAKHMRFGLYALIAVKLALEARCGFLLVPKITKRRAHAAMHAVGSVFTIQLATVLAATCYEHLFHQIGESTSTSDQGDVHLMPSLPNVRQETFAHLVAAGHSATAAYARAYGRDRDNSSRVNGRRLLINANIRDRIAQIRNEAALNSFPMLSQVIAEAERRAVERIRNGSFKQACEAAERFADMVIRLTNPRPKG
jgi:hypothetical protein